MQVDNLEANARNHKGKAKDLKNRLVDLETDSATAKGQIIVIKTDASELVIRVDTLQTQVDTLEGFFGTHAGKASDLENRVHALERSTSKLLGEMVSEQSACDYLQADVADLESLVVLVDIR